MLLTVRLMINSWLMIKLNYYETIIKPMDANHSKMKFLLNNS